MFEAIKGWLSRRRVVAPHDTYGRVLWESVSNLAYPVAGLWTGEPVFMVMMLGLGVASAYYHLGGRKGNHWDVGAIYAVLFFMALAMWLTNVPLLAFPAAAIPAAFWLRMKQMDVPMEHKIGGIMLVILGFGISSGLLFGASDALLAFGISSGTLVVALALRRWVDHGVWHVLSAYGLAMLWHGVAIIRTL